MSAKTITKGIVSVGTWSATKLVVTGLVLPIYSRILGIDGYGQYAYYVALLLISSHPANFGMRHALTKYIAERPNDRVWQERLAELAAAVNTVSAGIVGGAVLLILLAGAGFSPQALIVAAVVVGILWCEQASLYASGILYGLHREEEATLPASLGVIVGAAVGAGLVTTGFGVLGALSGMLCSGVLVAAITLRRSRRAIHDAPDTGNDEPIPRRAFMHFGMSTMAYAGVAMMLYSIDILLVRHFSGDQQTGFYAAAVQWSEFVWFLPIAIEGVMVQSTAHLWVRGQVEEITRLVSRLMRYVAMTTAFLLIFVLAFAEHIVTVYFGPEFQGATLPLQLLIPGAFAFSLARVIRPVIQAHGWVVTLLKIVFAATVMNILLNVAFVPRWGAAGAAVATSVSFIGVAMMYVRLLQEEGAHPFQGFSWGRFMLLCAGTSAVLVPIAKAISVPLVALTVGGIVAFGLYWGGVFRLGLIRLRELEQMVDSLPGPIRRIAISLMHLLQPILVRLGATAAN